MISFLPAITSSPNGPPGLEKAKKEVIWATMRVSDLLVNAVNGGVQEIFVNEKRIEMEIRALTATIMHFFKQTDQWLIDSHAINNAVKEKIMRVPYGPHKEYFKYSLFLVFCNRITTSAVSAGVLLASKKVIDPVDPIYKYCVVSVSNILTTTCQYEELKYVSFPVQNLRNEQVVDFLTDGDFVEVDILDEDYTDEDDALDIDTDLHDDHEEEDDYY